MKIEKVKIVNYKSFKEVIINMNEDINIFVGENDAGKTTILESILMTLTGKINGVSVFKRLNPDWFNREIRNDFKEKIEANQLVGPPSIYFEVYLKDDDTDILIQKFRGINNSLREDAIGVKLEIIFDQQYSAAYQQLLTENTLKDIPIEYYKVNYRTFANPEYYIPITSQKVVSINTFQKDYGPVLNRFISNTIHDYLTEEDCTELRHAYRANRHEFTEHEAVKKLNEKIQENNTLHGKTISINLRENGIDDWKEDMSIALNDIPLENTGFGTQNIFKSEMILRQNTDVNILVVEEPENNLSYANMSILISELEKANNKQLIISTHSSFVANKLGLQHLHLVSNHQTVPFSSLEKSTYDYFLKLPGYNTLRILLAKHSILVEGPSDELIIQRAYLDIHGKLPIMDGVDVICVDSLAFQQYCKLASLIRKKLTIVTDNDGNVENVKNRYSPYGDIVKLCIENDNTLNTIEPSVLNANRDTFEKFKQIIYKGRDIRIITYDNLKEFMIKNKTEWSIRVFNSPEKIAYPQQILDAISIDPE